MAITQVHEVTFDEQIAHIELKTHTLGQSTRDDYIASLANSTRPHIQTDIIKEASG